MLTAYMTENEVKKEVLLDAFNAFRYEDSISNKFRRLVLKATRFPVYSHITYMSPRKNRWLIVREARNKKEVLDNCRITYAVTHDTPHGLYCVMLTWVEGDMQLVFYPPHFFSRFRTRLNLNETGIKLMFRFLQFNTGYVNKIDVNENNNGQPSITIIGSTHEGVSLGFITEYQNVMFKTFITYDMLKGQQVETCFKNKELLNEIHNKP